MKHFLGITLCLASLFPTLVRSGPPEPEKAIPPAEIERVRAILPEDWSMTIQEDTLIVRRDRTVPVINLINAPAGPDDTEGPTTVPMSFEIRLKFQPLISDQEYRRWADENETSARTRETLQERVAGIDHKFGEYSPKTAEQTRLVEAYQKAAARLLYHPLPDGHTDQNRIDVTTSLMIGLLIADKTAARECRHVETLVRRLYRPYETDDH